MREVIVKHHIFKNAGSTIDAVLRGQFGADVLSVEGPFAWSVIAPAELLDFICAHPDARVVTSHQARLVSQPDARVVVRSIVLLRHPIDRVQSIYEFLRRSPLAPSPQSRAAHTLELREFVHWRLEKRHPVVRNYQTLFIGGRGPALRQIECDDDDFKVASAQLTGLPVFGLVEQFDESLRRFAAAYGHLGLTFAGHKPENANPDRLDRIEARLEDIKQRLGSATFEALVAANRYDMALYEFASTRFGQGA